MFLPRKALLALLFACMAPAIYGAVTTTESTSVSLYKGTSKIADTASWDACRTAARDAANKITTGTATYICRTETWKLVGTYTADPTPPPPPPTCPSTKPADLTRSQTCPTGTTGSWTQTSTSTAAPYPTCWIIGDWLPSSPPAGACTTVVEPPPPPPPTGALYSSDCTTKGPGAGSADVPSRDGTKGVCKLTIAAGGQFFGGVFTTQELKNGDEIWVKMDHYFPTAFCAGSGTVSGDYWGPTKWMRMDWGGSSGSNQQRFTFELGNFGRSTCATNGPNVWGAVPEISTISGQWVDPYNYLFPTQAVFPRDKWAAWQVHIKIGTTRATSFIEGWLDDKYLGVAPVTSPTMPDLVKGSRPGPNGGYLVDFYVGNYWNGGSLKANTWYMDNFVVTKTPNAKDSGGRAYIAP